MNNQDWIEPMLFKDLAEPNYPNQGDPVYTLTYRDLIQMPEVDFYALAKVDPEIQALLN